jgi:hypothetical protein
MLVIKSLVDDMWGSVPYGSADEPQQRTLVQSLEHGLWCVNSIGVPVFPGLVVGFIQANDARFFTDRSHRATRPYVETGTILAFDEDDDARYFVGLGVAEELLRNDAQTFLARARECPAPAPTSSVVPMRTKGGQRAAIGSGSRA